MITHHALNDGWHRLHPRMIGIHCAWLLAPAATLAGTAILTNGHLELRAWIGIASITVTAIIVVAISILKWSSIRYRILPTAFELRSGIIVRTTLSVPLRQIRSVDVTAPPLQRLLGLATVRIGASNSSTGRNEVTLAGVPAGDAAGLHQRLANSANRPAEDDALISAWSPRWLRFAPLTIWGAGGVLVAVGTLYRILDSIGIEPWRLPIVQDAAAALGASNPWQTLPLVLLGIIVLGSAGAVVTSLEAWWRFRLEWGPEKSLRLRRGLVTSRAISIDRAKIRGAVLRESLLLRAGTGAAVRAIAGGLGTPDESRRRDTILPAAPRADAIRVIERILSVPEAAFGKSTLIAHPKAALRRRFSRGMILVVGPLTAATGVLTVLFAAPAFPAATLTAAAVATAACAWVARGGYGRLGHSIAGDYLVARSGYLASSTVLLDRDGILAWTFSSTPFARRNGLTTATAAVAAGEHGYRIPDMDAATAAQFAHAARPGILDEYLSDPPPCPGSTLTQTTDNSLSTAR